MRKQRAFSGPLVAIVSESYSYASFKTRVLASYGFLKSILQLATSNEAELRKRLAAASQPRDRLELRTKLVPLQGDRTVTRQDPSPFHGEAVDGVRGAAQPNALQQLRPDAPACQLHRAAGHHALPRR